MTIMTVLIVDGGSWSDRFDDRIVKLRSGEGSRCVVVLFVEMAALSGAHSIPRGQEMTLQYVGRFDAVRADYTSAAVGPGHTASG